MVRRLHTVLAAVSSGCSVPQGMFPRVTHPSATPPEGSVRLACVRPAASVRSEPGSNSQVQLQRPIPHISLWSPASSSTNNKTMPPNTPTGMPKNTARHNVSKLRQYTKICSGQSPAPPKGKDTRPPAYPFIWIYIFIERRTGFAILPGGAAGAASPSVEGYLGRFVSPRKRLREISFSFFVKRLKPCCNVINRPVRRADGTVRYP